MNFTYTYSIAISNALGLEHIESEDLSDQYFDTFKLPENYKTYGGGASGPKNGHYGCKHTDEAKRLISESRLGKPAYNKNKPNPEQSVRMKQKNPMKDPEIAKKVGLSKRGKEASNKIKTTMKYHCKWCGKSHTVIAKKKNIKSFCGKSCAASYSNTYRYISHPPAAEQASS